MALLYGVSYLADLDYAVWPLKMALATLNPLTWGNRKPQYNLPDIPILSTFVVSITFLIFS
jgi:hypothetical protein